MQDYGSEVALAGTSSYPDATFTLRLAFGTVKGYTEDGRAHSAVDDLWWGIRARSGPRCDR